MLTSIDVKFIFDVYIYACLSSSANILQIADVALRHVISLYVRLIFSSPS